MDRRTSAPQGAPEGDSRPQRGSGSNACPPSPPQGGTALIAGKVLALTVAHFFPDLNKWLDELPDRRDPEAIIYETRFMGWWGIALYLCQLGSRRQLDYDLDARDTFVLENLNRLTETQHDTRPVHDTLDYFVGHLKPHGLPKLRTKMVRRLIRMKVLDAARLCGKYVTLVDGSGTLCFHRRHCDHCLVQRHEHTTVYLHNVLEAKLLGPGGVVVSVASEFIENADADAVSRKGADRVKQDCELKALDRLAPQLKAALPRTGLVIGGDSLFACGRVLQLCKDNRWSYVLTFKKGHMSAVWADFQGLLKLCPENVFERTLPDGTRQVYRWVRP